MPPKRKPRTIAFLRAINVGGHNVTMERLRALFMEMGLVDVETFIASGNVIFRSTPGKRATLETKIGAHLKKSLGYDVATFLRSDAEVAAIATHRAFPEAERAAAAALNVGFLAAPLSAAGVATLKSLRTEIDDFHVNGTEVYWLCRRRQSASKFTNALFERRLGVSASFRGINTIVRLAKAWPA